MHIIARRLATVAGRVAPPLVSALVAFEMTSRATAFDALRGLSSCGNPLQAAMPQVLGHCVLCWESAGAAALAAAMLIQLLARAARPATYRHTDVR